LRRQWQSGWHFCSNSFCERLPSVSAIGTGVDDFKIGDSVFGVCAAGPEGAYAEKLAARAAIIGKKPKGISHIDAAAVEPRAVSNSPDSIFSTLKRGPARKVVCAKNYRSTVFCRSCHRRNSLNNASLLARSRTILL